MHVKNILKIKEGRKKKTKRRRKERPTISVYHPFLF